MLCYLFELIYFITVLQNRLQKQLDDSEEDKSRLQQLVLRLENRLQKQTVESEEVIMIFPNYKFYYNIEPFEWNLPIMSGFLGAYWFQGNYEAPQMPKVHISLQC